MDGQSRAALELARRGDSEALRLAVRGHMPLVRALCARVDARDEDAFQQGCLALVKAIRGFDGARGTSFSTYAVPFILGGIRSALRARACVRMGWRARRDLRRARMAGDAFFAEHGREPDMNELSDRLQMDVHTLVMLLEQRVEPVSLDDEEGARWCERLPDPRAARWLERFMLRDMVSRLPPRDQTLIFLRYVRGEPQTVAAAQLRLSQPQLSRREARLRLCLRQAWLGDAVIPAI